MDNIVSNNKIRIQLLSYCCALVSDLKLTGVTSSCW